MPPRRPHVRLLLHACGALLVAMAAACDAGSPTSGVPDPPTARAAPTSPTPAPGPVPSLAGFPACGPPPAPTTSAPAGASLPPDARVVSVDLQDPLTYVTGYVPSTPVAIRHRYEADGSLEILVIEDEVVEVEVLVTDGSHRTFLKGNAVCATGSRFIAVVAPEVAASLVPTPTGPPAS